MKKELIKLRGWFSSLFSVLAQPCSTFLFGKDGKEIETLFLGLEQDHASQ